MSKLATDYAHLCVSPDENKNSEQSQCLGAETAEVYVWGSNSSYQLAEGNQEKILQPKLATAFSNVQQVGDRMACMLMVCLRKENEL